MLIPTTEKCKRCGTQVMRNLTTDSYVCENGHPQSMGEEQPSGDLDALDQLDTSAPSGLEAPPAVTQFEPPKPSDEETGPLKTQKPVLAQSVAQQPANGVPEPPSGKVKVAQVDELVDRSARVTLVLSESAWCAVVAAAEDQGKDPVGYLAELINLCFENGWIP